MVEIYWIQRVGELSAFFDVMWIFAITVLGVFLIFSPMAIEIIRENNITNQAKRLLKRW